MIAAIIQARTGSTRLKGKVLLPIGNKPMIERVLERVSAATTLDRVILATTYLPEDDDLAAFVSCLGYYVYRGHPTDVLDRYYRAALVCKADTVVRITGDCPLVSPGLIDRTVGLWGLHCKSSPWGPTSYDYFSTAYPVATFPDGLDVEVIKFAALQRAWAEAELPSDREHVTPYIWRQPWLFDLGALKWESDLSHLRWTVDTETDLTFVREVYRLIGRDVFSMNNVLELLERYPGLSKINVGQERNEGYRLSVEREKVST